jgi:hypothetical protein
MNRASSVIQRFRKLNGVEHAFPSYTGRFNVPSIDVVEDQVNLFTPAPPIQRNQSEKVTYRMVKKFSTRYESLFLLVVKPGHEAVAPFSKIYEEEKLSNVN